MSNLQTAINAFPGGQAALAKKLGMTQGAISHWVRGRSKPNAQDAPRVEAILGVRCEELRPELEWVRDAEGRVTGYHVPVSTQPDEGELAEGAGNA